MFNLTVVITVGELNYLAPRFLKSAETRYVPIEGECLGVAWALEQTRYLRLVVQI